MSNNNILVSIVIPCYNSGKYILECLKSCIFQFYQNIEIVVVDDGSTDNTMEKVSQFEKDHNISITKVRHYKNLGLPSARNSGIREAKGDWVRLIDSDDMFTKKGISKMIESLKPNTDIVIGKAYGVDDDVTYEWCLEHKKELKQHGKWDKAINCQATLIHKNIFKKYGLFCPWLTYGGGEDKEMWVRLGLFPYSPFKWDLKVVRINSKVAFYRRHDESMHRQRKGKPELKKISLIMLHKRINEVKKEGLTKENTEWL